MPNGNEDEFARLQAKDNGLQIYRDENVVVKDGYVSLIAKKETSTWAGITKSWTSGMIRTKNKINFDRGKWEIRCKIPKGDGFWCAFWGSGGDEIDIFESGSVKAGKLNEEIHTEYEQTGKKAVNTGAYWQSLNFDFSADFHTYSIIWDKLYVAWLIDDQEVKRIWGYLDAKQAEISRTDLPGGTYYKVPYFPIDPQCLIANFAISNHNDFGHVSSNTPNNASFVIDYIRVYQRNDNIQSGYEDVCNFKLKPIGLICNNGSQSITINSNTSNFKTWTASNATIANSTSANITFTPLANSLIKIEATAKDYCNTKNVLELWYGKPKHTVKVAPIRCSKCWIITFDNLEIMKADPIWDIGTTPKYSLEDCTGSTTFSIPASLTSSNSCGTYGYSTTIKSININCTSGNTGTQFSIPISNELKMEDLFGKLEIENLPIESSIITLYNLSDYSKYEIKSNEARMDNLIQSKGLYVIHIQNLETGLYTYFKLMRF